MRFPLTVLIIYLHSFGDPLTENPTLGLAIYDNVRIFFSHILSRVAVPTFLVISGYLFFRKTEEIFDAAIYKKKLVSRYHSIFIPYVLWNLGYLLQIVVAKSAKIIIKHEDANIIGYFNEHGWLNMFWACNQWPYRTSWFGWEITTSGPLLVPLWYLRDLIVAFLLSWLIWKVIKKTGWLIVALLFFCDMSGLWPNIPGLEAYAISYFVLGSYMAINKMNLVSTFSSYSKPILGVTFVLTVLMLYFKSDFTKTGNYIYPFFELFGMMSVFIMGGRIVQSNGRLSKIPRLFTESSFFVYAIHTILILMISYKVTYFLIPNGNPALMTIRYMVTPLFCATICVSIYWILSCCTPRLLKIMTGGRSK